MGIALWLVIGAACGAGARFVMPGPKAGGIPIGIAVGVAGGLIGGLAGALTGSGISANLDARNSLIAACGTLYSLLVYRAYALKHGEG